MTRSNTASSSDLPLVEAIPIAMEQGLLCSSSAADDEGYGSILLEGIPLVILDKSNNNREDDESSWVSTWSGLVEDRPTPLMLVDTRKTIARVLSRHQCGNTRPSQRV